MRTLLVDNYDSFTYNLFHLLAEVNGEDPVVIRNDDPRWHPGMLGEFGSVVLSPGPGSPHRSADFGICTQIARAAPLPVLGVCLGHQGIALAHGASVGRAPEPRHGRTSAVRHDGTGLFAGLPDPLEAVRYHSLAASSLPPELEATAWSPDGVVMALRHRSLPLWGVQFHPESIGTHGGHQLLANFAGLAARWHAGRGSRPAPRPAPPRPPAPKRTSPEPRVRNLRVLAERMLTRWDPEVAFGRLFQPGNHAYWLDSSVSEDECGRFSIMGDASGPLARIAKADVSRGTVTLSGRDTASVQMSGFFDWLDADLRTLRTEVPELPGDFALGWVGYLGYELKAECEGDATHRSPTPDAAMVFADRALLFDHRTHITYLLALAEDGDEHAARDWLHLTAAVLDSIAHRAPLPCPAPAPLPPGHLRLRHGRRGYLDRIHDSQDEIRAGETYEVCLTNMAEAQTALDPWHAYRFLRRTSPAPFGAYLGFGDVHVLSTSPERFLRIGAAGAMESKPIKGTRPRGATPEEDTRLAADLATSEKDRAENLMIVDLVRHDLGRCAGVGSVRVDPVFAVESYASVHQLVSTVRAQLRDGETAVTGVRCAFPGGSMTGAPKIRTMQIIDRLEEGPRGIYSGAIGYFSLTGAADLSIVIRTAVMTGGRISYGVGGAIIALSDPHAEYEETAVKATPLLRLLSAGFPDREAVPAVTAGAPGLRAAR